MAAGRGGGQHSPGLEGRGSFGRARGVCILCGLRAVATGPVPRDKVFPTTWDGAVQGRGLPRVRSPPAQGYTLGLQSLPANYLHVDKTLYPDRLLPGLAASGSRGRRSLQNLSWARGQACRQRPAGLPGDQGAGHPSRKRCTRSAAVWRGSAGSPGQEPTAAAWLT